MNQLPLFSQSKSVRDFYQPDAEIILYQGDSNNLIKTIPNNSVSLIITSPPYNLGKDYEKKISLDTYLETQTKIMREFPRILQDNGSICWQVGNFVQEGEVYPLDIFYYQLFKQMGFFLRNRIVWHFGHGLHTSKRFSGRYETILWLTKTDKYTFNLDPVRIPAKYPGKRHFKGKNIGKPSGNPLGKNPSDVWEFLAQEWDELLWDIPNVKSNHPEKTIHPCQYPIELVERCVLALTNEGDWVFDPFAGVGTSLIASIMHNRRVMGSEKEAEYVKIARERIAAYLQGNLKIRPLGKPIHQPTGQEKVAQIPEEWHNNI